MQKEKNNFKRGQVYKSLSDLWRMDPDCRGDDKDYFTKGKVYPCRKDGTLYSMDGVHEDVKITEELNDKFELVGVYTPKMDYNMKEEEAMRQAFQEEHSDFEKFYALYNKKWKEVDKKNNEINDRSFIYLDGVEGSFWTEHGSLSKSRI